MRRREFITLMGSAAAWPLTAHAQRVERTRRIERLMTFKTSLVAVCCSSDGDHCLIGERLEQRNLVGSKWLHLKPA